jgi:hypothetical protein
MSCYSLAHNHWRSWRLPACYYIILCSLYVVARYTWPAASSCLAEFASAACGRQVGFALLFPKVQDCGQFHGVAVCSFNLRVVAHCTRLLFCRACLRRKGEAPRAEHKSTAASDGHCKCNLRVLLHCATGLIGLTSC